MARGGGERPLLCAVVKANAYGHGLVPCARVFSAAGAEWLAVTSVAEGRELRAAGVRRRILVLGSFDGADAPWLARWNLTPTLWNLAQWRLLRAAAPRWRQRPPLRVHLKFDIGMARLGAEPSDAVELARRIAATPGLELEAVYSHLGASESSGPLTRAQLRRWRDGLRVLRAAGAPLGRFQHLANSAAAWRLPASRGGLVRVGLGLYGYSLAPSARPFLRPALSWRARIIAVRDLPAGRTVGYGGAYVTTRSARLATLAVGYADGYSRRFGRVSDGGGGVIAGGGPHVLVRGRRAPIVGRISMDLTTVDVSRIPGAALGDAATLIGRDGERFISADDLAAWSGTIAYEVLCGIGARVPRILAA